MKNGVDLGILAGKIMVEKGLEPDFSDQVNDQLSKINEPAYFNPKYQDFRHLKWCSIDNDDSKDLDQLTYAQKEDDGLTSIWIAVADVACLVAKDTPVDIHAQINTTSVYTPTKIFPMLPAKLSTNLTSLNPNHDRLAIVTKILLNNEGVVEKTVIFHGFVHNFAQLTYNEVNKWLKETDYHYHIIEEVEGLAETLRIQHEMAQILKENRYQQGSLTLESSEAEVKVQDHTIKIQLQEHQFANQLIEEFMIAANQAMAKYFKEARLPNLRRVVKEPQHWDRIVEIASELGESLPKDPDSKALNSFLCTRKKSDPLSFPDLSLTIIKLLGRGEYVVENDNNSPAGHFALAITEYTHSTAPNRRYPDLISQRQFKAHLKGEKPPYTLEELYILAQHCSHQEDAAMKVQRHMNKSAAAMLLADHIGQTFQGIITGSSEKGIWVRIFEPAVEGKIIQGNYKPSVGDRVTVQLKLVDISKGFIDFVMVTDQLASRK